MALHISSSNLPASLKYYAREADRVAGNSDGYIDRNEVIDFTEIGKEYTDKTFTALNREFMRRGVNTLQIAALPARLQEGAEAVDSYGNGDGKINYPELNFWLEDSMETFETSKNQLLFRVGGAEPGEPPPGRPVTVSREAVLKALKVQRLPPLQSRPNVEGFTPVFIDDMQHVDGPRRDAYVNPQTGKFYLKVSGAGPMGPQPPSWYGPGKI